MWATSQAVRDELEGRKGFRQLLEEIDEDIVVELCDAVAAAVLKAEQDDKHGDLAPYWPEED